MIVYKTTNIINGKFYIGKDTNNDPNYLGSGILLKKAIKKYGRSNFEKEILEHCTLVNINEREKYWINVTQAKELGYNLADGGTGGDLGEYVNNKRSKTLTGKKQTKETINKRAKTLQGRTVTWGDKISESMTGKTWVQKKPRTKEHRDKLSKANIGHTKSSKTIEKMSKSKIGKPSPTKGKYKIGNRYYTRKEYEIYCKKEKITPKKQLDLIDIENKRKKGVYWKTIAEEYGYNKETVRIWYKNNKN